MESKVQLLINKCNKINKSDKGLEIDEIEEDDYIKWKLYDITINDDEFKIGDTIIKYQLIHTKINDSNKPLLIIPGFSDKSVCWTIGRINRYITEFSEIFQKYSDIYIINLENVKDAMNILKLMPNFSRDTFDLQISEHIDKILSMLYNKHDKTKFVILARSAGGGQAILLIFQNKNNGKIKSVFLMAPGYKKLGLSQEDKDILLELNDDDEPLPITLAYVNKDTRIPRDEIIELKRVFEEEIKYKKFKYIEIDRDESIIVDGNRDRHFHRFQPELVELL